MSSPPPSTPDETLGPLAAVTNLVVADDTDRVIRMSWDAVVGAAAYRVSLTPVDETLDSIESCITAPQFAADVINGEDYTIAVSAAKEIDASAVPAVCSDLGEVNSNNDTAVMASTVLLSDVLASPDIIPDSAFRDCIASYINAPNSDDVVTTLGELTVLSCNGYTITDITGIEYLTGLNDIELSNHEIASLSPLSGLRAGYIQNLDLDNYNMTKDEVGDDAVGDRIA